MTACVHRVSSLKSLRRPEEATVRMPGVIVQAGAHEIVMSTLQYRVHDGDMVLPGVGFDGDGRGPAGTTARWCWPRPAPGGPRRTRPTCRCRTSSGPPRGHNDRARAEAARAERTSQARVRVTATSDAAARRSAGVKHAPPRTGRPRSRICRPRGVRGLRHHRRRASQRLHPCQAVSEPGQEDPAQHPLLHRRWRPGLFRSGP